MTGADDQNRDSADVQNAGDADATARISEHLSEHGGDDAELIEELPAGNAGADAGAGGAAGIDPDSEASVQDESMHNDAPGIGTRRSGD